MIIDLHTHSTASDGTEPPAALVRHARDVGIDVLGLTDHDTTAGWAGAAAAAEAAGIRLVRGIEVSTATDRLGVHLLAYAPDPHDRGLTDELAAIVHAREDRLQAMLDNLAGVGIELSEADVRRHSGDAEGVGRPHVAQALVDAGHVPDVPSAFAELLAPGGPVWAKRYAPDTAAMIRIVTAAGGAAVIAHPWGRRGGAGRSTRDVLTGEVLEQLVVAGLVGVEVDHPEHDPTTRDELRALARDLGLVVTGGSDYHGTRKVGHELGCDTTMPEELERLLAAADLHAQARSAAMK